MRRRFNSTIISAIIGVTLAGVAAAVAGMFMLRGRSMSSGGQDFPAVPDASFGAPVEPRDSEARAIESTPAPVPSFTTRSNAPPAVSLSSVVAPPKPQKSAAPPPPLPSQSAAAPVDSAQRAGSGTTEAVAPAATGSAGATKATPKTLVIF